MALGSQAMTSSTNWGRAGALGGILGLGLGLATPIACTPEIDPQQCSEEAMGSAVDWRIGHDQAAPECDREPGTPLGVCVGQVLLTEEAGPSRLELEGTVVEVGTGEPPITCSVLNTIGEMYDIEDELLVPPEWVQWVRIDEGGATRVIAMVVPLGGPSLEVGDEVTGWLEWTGFGEPATFELSDVLGPWWWLSVSGRLRPMDYAPQCPTIRPGVEVCKQDLGAFGVQHHYAVTFDGVSVPPGSQVSRGDLRFINGALRSLGGPCEVSDCYGEHRAMAAIRD